MHPTWQDFLHQQGARIVEGRVADYGQPEAERQIAAQGTTLCDLAHLALFEVAGDDAATFLQGQLTNDIRLLDGSNSQYAGHCSPKGRLLALFLVFARKNCFFLQCHGLLKESIAKRLKMYVLRSRVTLTDLSDEIVRLGVAGPQAEDVLQQEFGALPQASHRLHTSDDVTLLRLPGPVPRFEVFVPLTRAPRLWLQFIKTCRPVGADVWDWLEIQAGIPDIVPATQEQFVPQMVNLDSLGGISFKKGCYTGQEIVARTHYLGKIKRRTRLAHVALASAPAPGTPVYGLDSTEPVGQVVRSAPAPDGGYSLLLECRLESLEAGPLRLADGTIPTLGTLPYSAD